jgi:ribose transport system substrate-binding protein
MEENQMGRVLKISIIGAAILAAGAWVSTAQAQDAGLERARAMIKLHSALPVFSAPGPAFDARACAGGKRILTLPVSSANPFTKNIALAIIAAGKEVGIDVVE